MKILLAAINAKYIHSNLALYSMRAALGPPYGERMEIAEYTINQQTDEILKDIYRKQPDLVAFSCYLWNRRMIGTLLRELPKILPEVILWVGGPEASCDAEAFLKVFPGLSGVMRGEGEGTFRKLADYYMEGTGMLFDIPGITFREKDGKIESTGDAEVVDLNRLPFPYEDQDLGVFRHKILYYESSRGCPFRCSYCLSSIEKQVRFRSLPLVKRDLEAFLEARVPQVKFVDRTFNIDAGRTNELWEWLLEHDNGVTNFHFEIGADRMTEEELEIMSRMRPGLIQLEIGVQSVNPDVIRNIHRTMDLKRLKEAVTRIHGFQNIHQHLDLIAGLPGEDLQSFRRSFDEVFALEPDQLQLGFLKVLRGTPLYEQAEALGIVYRGEPPYEVLRTNWLSYEDLLLLKGVEEMVEIYYNSGQFRRTLKKVLKSYESPFAFFRELAEYYESQGYDKIHHSRMARYEILREFLETRGFLPEEFDPCMVYDLYAREDLKSRPPFAVDLKPYKKQLKAYEAIYGRQVHIEVFEQREGPLYVLFDYEKRNVLTKEAYAEVLH